jgi:hypothetical protein
MNATGRLAALPSFPDFRRVSRAPVVAVLVWAVAVSIGLVWIWDYKTTPGLASGPPPSWSQSTGLRQSGMTLVMTLHPLCTCSQASVSELARLMAGAAPVPTVYALFVDFGGRTAGARGAERIEETTLWQRAAAIPGVIPVADPDGAIARSFGAETSGDVIAYAPTGELVFHGGLTPARGHEGDSAGRQRLLAALRGDVPDFSRSPVFGCPLRSDR